MKFIAIFAALVVTLALSHVEAQINPIYSGQPGCKTEEEIRNGVYRHFRNKQAYWRCSTLGQAGTFSLCPHRLAFFESARACVPWAEWYWTPTVAPPSYP